MDQTAMGKVRTWVQEQMEGRSSAKLPKIADEGKKHFLQKPEVIEALFGERLKALIYDIAQKTFADTRSGAVLLGDEAVDREELARRAAQTKKKWDRWLEHSGDRHVLLQEMNRVQLLTAAAEREARSDSEFKHACFLRALAEPLKGKQKVGQVFSPEEIDAEWRRIHGEQKKETTTNGRVRRSQAAVVHDVRSPAGVP